MATSGSYDWNVTRNQIVNRALRIIGHLDPQETPSAEDVSTAVEALNALFKSWNNTIMGLQLWTVREATVFPQYGKFAYTLGTSDAPSAWSYTTVAVQATASTGTTVEITSGVGAAGDFIGIYLGDGTSQWGTISAVSASGTAHLATSLSSTATASNNVWIFTNLMERPIEILHARVESNNGDDLELNEYDRERYYEIYDKDRLGEPRAYYFDKQRDNPVLYFDVAADDPNELVKIVYRRMVEDFDSTTDNPDVPPEVVNALVWGLADQIGIEYGVPTERMREIRSRANEAMLQIRALYGDRPRATLPSVCL